MSDEVFCQNPECGKFIPEEVWKKRRNKAATISCSRACDIALRKQSGFYKRMSEAGRDKRSQAVAQSNREKPRRKRKDAPIFA